MVMFKGNKQLIYVGVVDPIHESNAWALVWIVIGELDMDFPEPAFVRC